MKRYRSSGFTLIEVLVALLVFSIGMLGLGLQLSRNLTVTIDKGVHSSVMQLALQAVEPLHRAAEQTPNAFRAALANVPNTALYTTNSSSLNTLNLSIALASDDKGQNLLTTNTNLWTPPYTVVLNVEYVPAQGDNKLNFRSTHIFVPPRGP